MSQFDQVSVIKKANVYFEGKCISHTVVCAHDVRKTIGVILPSTLTFNTGAPEVMEGVGGKCRVRLPGETDWKEFGEGELFKIPGNSAFDIEVAPGEAYHYVCHFG